MSVQSILAAGRVAALQVMLDTCLIERLGERVWNNATGDYTRTTTTIYTGQCRVKGSPGGGSDIDFAEHPTTLHTYTVSLPWDAEAEIKREDRFQVTASDDPWLVGRAMEVVDIALTGTSTARRISVQDRS